MRHSRSLIRLLAVALVAAAVLGASGCKWFRKGSDSGGRRLTGRWKSRPTWTAPTLPAPCSCRKPAA